jgi:3-deoxy-D-manno-octulosonic-acid transferase
MDFMYLFAAAAYSPMLIYKTIRYKRYRTGWAQRFGKITRNNTGEKCVWLHAVSVGEVNAAKTIIDEMQKKFSNYEIVISTTTDTGFARASNIFGEDFKIFYFPLDFSWIMRRAFHRINPSLCLLMELEVWPNFVHVAQKLSVPVIVVNGRISDKSLSRYEIIKPIAQRIFRKVDLVLAQTDEYAERFKKLGCPDEKVIVTGSLKYDTAQITDKVDGADVLAAQLFGKISNLKSQPVLSEAEGISNRLWVAGATGNDEEKILLEVFQNLKQDDGFQDLRLAIVPRKPERFNEVAQLIEQSGFNVIRYSKLKTLVPVAGEKSQIANRKSQINTVILGDTMGDLRKFYSLAAVIFVGRSLVPMGGSDMMEAAALGKCTIFGPYAFNFQQTVDALIEDNGAIMVKDKDDLLATMRKCLTEPDYADKIARNGQEVIRKNQGATAKSIKQIAKLLNISL